MSKDKKKREFYAYLPMDKEESDLAFDPETEEGSVPRKPENLKDIKGE